MADGSIQIRCPGCGNLNAVAMAVGQQLQCRVCQTVFFAPAMVAQAPAAAVRDNVRSSSANSETASQAPPEDAPAGGRIWTVITVIAGLLIVTTSFLVGVLLVRDRQQATHSPSANPLPGPETTPPRSAPSASHAPVHWSDAVLHAQRLGLLEVKVVRVKYGAVRAKDLNNEVITTDDTSLLTITVSVHNRGEAACAFRSWYAGGFESADGQEQLPELSDDLERAYSLLRFDDVSSIEGQRLADAIEPHQAVQDAVVFLVPADFDRTKIRFFRLSLPAHAIGTEDFFRLEIPVRMIDGFLAGAEAGAGAGAGAE